MSVWSVMVEILTALMGNDNLLLFGMVGWNKELALKAFMRLPLGGGRFIGATTELLFDIHLTIHL